jgi:uncharacterized protein
MSAENVEVVRRAYEAWNRGDADEATGVLAPDVEWRLPAHFPDAGVWRGREQVVEGLRSTTASWRPFRIEVHDLIDLGDRVLAIVRYRGRATITGMDLTGAHVDGAVWTLRDGLVVAVRMYSGTEDALKAVGLDRAT